MDGQAAIARAIAAAVRLGALGRWLPNDSVLAPGGATRRLYVIGIGSGGGRRRAGGARRRAAARCSRQRVEGEADAAVTDPTGSTARSASRLRVRGALAAGSRAGFCQV